MVLPQSEGLRVVQPENLDLVEGGGASVLSEAGIGDSLTMKPTGDFV